MVGPLALALEARGDRVVAQCLLLESQFAQLRIAAHQIAHNDHHLDDILPVGVFLGAAFLLVCGVEVVAFVGFAVFFGPGHRLFELLLVVDTLFDAADNLHFVDRFVAHAQVGLEEVCIDDRSGDTHRHRADRKVALAAHLRYGDACAREAEQFLFHVVGNGLCVGILHVVAVNAECGHSFLVVAGQCCGEVNRAGALGAVKTPNSLGHAVVVVDRFAAVAPARGNGDSEPYALLAELLGTGGSLGHASDRGIGDYALYRRAVGVFERRGDQFGHAPSHVHRLFFERLAYAALASVDHGTDTHFGVLSDKSFCLHVNGFIFRVLVPVAGEIGALSRAGNHTNITRKTIGLPGARLNIYGCGRPVCPEYW